MIGRGNVVLADLATVAPAETARVAHMESEEFAA